MKKLITTAIILAMFATFTTVTAQNRPEEYLGLPGDNLNLYAVMKLFQESETLEGFEKNLNDQNSRINNLDLNGDNFVDYINVIDYVDGEVHNIVMQVAVNIKEKQDVGVFTVQKFNNGQVQIQLIGDEDLYGKNYIIEPIFDEQTAEQTPNPGYLGNGGNGVTVVRTTTYQMANWPVVRYIYLPTYRPWRSAWYWGYYPSYWNTWTPYYWDFYYGYHYHWYDSYYRNYRRWDHPRYSYWNDYYYSRNRSRSTYVSVNINSGNYKSTYSKPEQRKQGEALYTRTATSQNSRREGQSTTNSSTRRVATEQPQNRQTTGTSTVTSRRATSTTPDRTVTGSSRNQSTGTTRSSSSTSTSRSVATPSRSQSTGTARSSSSTSASRSVATPSRSQSTGTARSSGTTSASRSTAAPKPKQSVSSSRTTAKPASKASSSSSSRSSTKKKETQSSSKPTRR